MVKQFTNKSVNYTWLKNWPWDFIKEDIKYSEVTGIFGNLVFEHEKTEWYWNI